jgi:hypothetical protein
MSAGVNGPINFFAIPGSTSAVGAWIKVNNPVAPLISQNCTFANGTFTAGLAGIWVFNINFTGVKTNTTVDRVIYMTAQQNVSDTTQALAVFANSTISGNSFISGNDLFPVIGTIAVNMALGDTLKVFLSNVPQTGATTADINVYSYVFTAALLQ